jgi:hypothetical protein
LVRVKLDDVDLLKTQGIAKSISGTAVRVMVEEFEHVLLVFRLKVAGLCEAWRTRERKPRQRREGCGVKEKLLFTFLVNV